MGISYRIDLDLGIVIEYWSGLIDFDTLRTHLQNIFLDPTALAMEKTLVNACDAVPSLSSLEFSALISRDVNPYRRGIAHWTAICVATNEQKRFAMAYYLHSEKEEISSVFTDEESAIAWLKAAGIR